MPEQVHFEVPELLALLPQGFGVGKSVGHGWQVDDVYFCRDDTIQFELCHEQGQRIAMLIIAHHRTSRPYARTAHFDILYDSSQADDPLEKSPQTRDVVDGLIDAIRSADPPQRIWEIPEPVAPIDGGAGPALSLTLGIESPCLQSCIFCSQTRLRPPPVGFDEPTHQDILSRIRTAARRAIDHLVLTGYEPLAYPLIDELLLEAKRLDFAAVEIWTTGVPLADLTFAGRLVQNLTDARHIHMPLYGANAKLHDSITQTPGSFDRAIAALKNLSALLLPEEVTVCTVILEQNLHGIDALRKLAHGYGFSFAPQMPFPSVGGRLDNYHQVAPRFSTVVATLHGLRPPIPVKDAPPCVLYAHEQKTNVPSLSRLVRSQRPLKGRDAATLRTWHGHDVPDPFVPAALCCPHLNGCRFADRCAQGVYREYVAKHGLDELQPVG